MGKIKYKDLRICVNYSKPCAIANKCESCKHRAVKFSREYGRTILNVVGCKAGHDYTATAKEKEKCFICSSEGTEKCK